VLWSELIDQPERLAVELATRGTTARNLACDVCDVPEHREACELLDERGRLLLALQVFGDQGRSQPPREERSEWIGFGYTSDFGRLGQLESEPAQPHETNSPAGGRPRKWHPGLALREAARLISNGEKNKTAIAHSATAKAREKIEPEELAARKWRSGFSERDDVAPLQAAMGAELVIWTPRALRVRETKPGVFRDVDDFEWLRIPQAE
jgi:hypothetical protein